MFLTDFDSKAFRRALGSFATGVAIVTTITTEGERLGLTLSSFNAVSLDPPLVLFSVARTARSFETWRRSDRYVVNVLNEDHHELSIRFGRSSGDKWTGVIAEDAEGGPVFDDAVACFDCSSYSRYDGGDHEIFVGRVLGITVPKEDAPRPLLFFGGRYRKIEHEAVSPA